MANVNIDGAPGEYYPMKDVVALGAEHSTLGNEVVIAGKVLDYDLVADPMPEENSFIRSDQYSFVLEGVPAVSVEDGVHSTDPTIDGLAVQKKWLLERYHTPLDNMDQPMDFRSMAKAAALNFLIGYQVAQRDQPPTWNKGDFLRDDVWLEARGYRRRRVAIQRFRVQVLGSSVGVPRSDFGLFLNASIKIADVTKAPLPLY
jgi:Zn-dependent M28 family amino/carboxypeptidase